VITGASRVAGVIGSPVRHSLSPAILNAAFTAADLDWVYVAFEVPEGRGGEAVAAVRLLDLGGLSVTMPHKAAACRAVDERTEVAAELGAVNCVFWRGGRLVGDNTDGAGFLDALRFDQGIEVAGRRCVVVGAGGAGKAVARALADAGASDVGVVNRSPGPAVAAARLAGPVGRVAGMPEVAAADLVVNATPLGMATGGARPQAPGLPLAPALLGPGQTVVDLVYHPLETPLLSAAAERGAAVVNGVGMLVHQAAHAFRRWTGAEPPLDAMVTAIGRELARRAASDNSS
jgi:shikimate dehydrogenase